MEILIKVIQFFLSLSLIIVLHELGHFIPAKLFKTRVEKFYLFFDIKYSLFKKRIGETVYGIGLDHESDVLIHQLLSPYHGLIQELHNLLRLDVGPQEL